jgi:uncharacterized membrane protein YjgN (DUF898 family)
MHSVPADSTEIPFQFHGKATEYFGIWIVNLLLMVLTLGIYSPWAKVRKKRYFYGSTMLADAPFDYLANPVAILKGRLIAFAAFVIYSVVVKLYPMSAPAFGIVFFIALPWLIVRSLAFNAYNSAYRNLRFHFERNYAKAIAVFAGLALLIPFTLGLILPYYAYRQKKFIVGHSGYGSSRYALDVGPGKFYGIYFKAFGMLLLLAALGSVAAALLFPQMAGALARSSGMGLHAATPRAAGVLVGVIMVGIVAAYLVVFAYVQTAISNLTWNHTTIAGHGFRSSLGIGRMIWLYLSNSIAIALSLGLLIPWARIRMARYRLDNLALLPHGSFDGFVAGEQENVSATGEELGEFFGVDISL